MEAFWVPDLLDIKKFSGHLWCSILIFSSGASSAWPSKHTNLLGCVVWPCLMFFKLKITKKFISDLRDCKTVSCYGNTIAYSSRSVASGTTGILSSNGFRWNVTEIVLFICFLSYWVSVWCQQSSHLRVLLIFKTQTSPELMQIFANSKQHF